MIRISKLQLHWISRRGKSLCNFSIVISKGFADIDIGGIDIPRLIELYNNRRLKLGELVSGHYSLDRINDAIVSMEEGKAIRNVIMF